MKDMIGILRAIRRRLLVQRYMNLAFRLLFWLLVVSLIILVVDRLIYIDPAVVYLPFSVIIGAVCLAIFGLFFKIPTLFQAALTADEHLLLKERLSSAYLLRDKPTDAAHALNEDAQAVAHSIDPARVVFLHLPRLAYFTFGLLFAVMLLNAYLPYYDIMNRKQRKIERQLEKHEAQAMAQEIKRLSRALTRQAEKTGDEKKAEPIKDVALELDKLARDLELDKIERKDAAVKLSTLQEKISERQNVMQDELKNLSELSQSTDKKFTGDLAKALANADPQAAETAMQKLAEIMKSANLSKDDIERLKKELEQLAQAAQKMNPELAKKLAEAAKNMEIGELLKAAENLDLSAEELLEVAEAFEQMKMLGKLSDDLEARKRALLGDIGILGSGEDGKKIGPGMGDKGTGEGGDAPFDDTAQATFTDTRIAGEKGKGKIINEVFFKGQPFSSDAVEEYKDVYVESRQSAEDSLTKEFIPAGYRTYVKNYFDAINPERISQP